MIVTLQISIIFQHTLLLIGSQIFQENRKGEISFQSAHPYHMFGLGNSAPPPNHLLAKLRRFGEISHDCNVLSRSIKLILDHNHGSHGSDCLNQFHLIYLFVEIKLQLMLHYALIDVFRARKGDDIVSRYFDFYILEVTEEEGVDQIHLKVFHVLLQPPFAGFHPYILFGERLQNLPVFEFQGYTEEQQ